MVDSTSWKRERDYSVRGQRESSYVITNGIISQTESDSPYDYFDPDFGGDVTTPFTTGTTLLAVYNNDAMIVPNGIYGETALGRPCIIDEIGIKLIKDSTCNFHFYQLNANVLWINQDEINVEDWYGTCEQYWAAMLQITGGGSYDLGHITTLAPLLGIAIGSGVMGITSGARMTVIQVITNQNFYGIMADATDFTPGEYCTVTTGGGTGTTSRVVTFSRQTITVSTDNLLRYGVDRYYNNEIDLTYYPLGRGPNVLVAYAAADGEKIADNCNKILVPFICDGTQDVGIWRPPKDSVIVDVGQAFAIQFHSLSIPPTFVSWTTQPYYLVVPTMGDVKIAVWIRFRQPLVNESANVRALKTNEY